MTCKVPIQACLKKLWGDLKRVLWEALKGLRFLRRLKGQLVLRWKWSPKIARHLALQRVQCTPRWHRHASHPSRVHTHIRGGWHHTSELSRVLWRHMTTVSHRTHSKRIVHSLPERSTINWWQDLVAIVIHWRMVHLRLTIHRRWPTEMIALGRELLWWLVVSWEAHLIVIITSLILWRAFKLVSSFPLRCWVQFDCFCQNIVALTITYACSCLLLLTESQKPIPFWNFSYRVGNYFSLNDAWVFFLEKVQKHRVVDILVQVADVNLIVTLGCRLNLVWSVECCLAWLELLDVFLVALLIRCPATIETLVWLYFVKLVFGSMWRPIQFKAALRTLDSCSVKTHVNIFCNFVAGKLYEAIPHWRSFNFVANQLYRFDCRDLQKVIICLLTFWKRPAI